MYYSFSVVVVVFKSYEFQDQLSKLEEAKVVFFEYMTVLTEDVFLFLYSSQRQYFYSLTFNPPTSDVPESIVMVAI